MFCTVLLSRCNMMSDFFVFLKFAVMEHPYYLYVEKTYTYGAYHRNIVVTSGCSLKLQLHVMRTTSFILTKPSKQIWPGREDIQSANHLTQASVLHASWRTCIIDGHVFRETAQKVSLSCASNHSPPPVWAVASAPCVNVKRSFFLWQISDRRRYDPATFRTLSCSKSVNCEAGGAQGRKSSESSSPVCCCCRNQDILPAPHRNSRDFFWWLYLLLPMKVIPQFVASSPPPGSVWLCLHFLKCVSADGKRDLTTVMKASASWHTSSCRFEKV